MEETPGWHAGIMIFAVLLLASCQTAYYGFWETLGREKRDLLTSQVAAARDDQEEVQEVFKDTLEKIRHTYDFRGGDLEEIYDSMSAQEENARESAGQLKERIEKVDRIAGDLFEEWEEEAKDLGNAEYRRDSLAKLSKAKKRYAAMIRRMRAVEKTLDPVLAKFHDQVIYLKHNLNAKALDVFKAEFSGIEKDIERLIGDIQGSIAASQAFLAEMK